MKNKYSHCTAQLAKSQLSFRMGLARKRLSAYPLDDENFIYADIERPETVTRMAHWCTGDLTGRMLEALTATNGIDGNRMDEYLSNMFGRIIRQTQKNGLIGRRLDKNGEIIENDVFGGADKLLPALVEYYFAFGDIRALDAAIAIADHIFENRNAWMRKKYDPDSKVDIKCWITDAFAMLYQATKDDRYLDFVREAGERIGEISGSHTHGFLTTMRGFSKLAFYTEDQSWMALPEKYRKMIIENNWETGSGDISENFPTSRRNEICSVADWLMLNLWSGFILGDDSAYEKAEHVLWNAMFFGQIVTGGAGHRQLIPRGYGNDEFQEAWWCCTESFLLASREVARNVVTRRGDDYRINFLIPGDYEIDGLKFRISTRWPGKVDSIITVNGLDDDAKLHLRIPSVIKNARETRTFERGVLTIRLSGDIGYSIEQYNGLYMLKYGSLVLAPSNYTWNGQAPESETTVPEGYIPNAFPGVEYSLELPPKDENGFYMFEHLPLPSWSFYEEGPDSRTAFEGVTVNAKIRFKCGVKGRVRFWPLCYNVSTLTLYTTPYLFDLE
jgi:hypothetical protein